MPGTDKKILELLPHRDSMLLVHQLDSISATRAQARVFIDESVPFYHAPQGVPAWIALEYMGQAAAMIAGHQQQLGRLGNHLGFLLSVRNFKSSVTHFPPGSELLVVSEEIAIVGDNLATFECSIRLIPQDDCAATANLSVYRDITTNAKL